MTDASTTSGQPNRHLDGATSAIAEDLLNGRPAAVISAPDSNRDKRFLLQRARDLARSPVVLPAVLVVVIALVLWTLVALSAADGKAQFKAAVLSLLAVSAGCLVLTWMRPQRAGLSPPHVMLSLGFGGMLLGLSIDTLQHGPTLLDSVCRNSSGLGFQGSLMLHLSYLPAMHVGMLIGGLSAIPTLRALQAGCGRYFCSMLAQNLMCSSWMLIGMTLGALWLRNWQMLVNQRAGLGGGADSLSGMLGGMFAGMTWGMVISVALYRLYLIWRTQPKRALKAA